jgi:hypothetical protein
MYNSLNGQEPFYPGDREKRDFRAGANFKSRMDTLSEGLQGGFFAGGEDWCLEDASRNQAYAG